MLVSAVYFSAGFCMITVAERLFTRGSGVEVASFARAIVGGLIVAKVLLLVDLVPFVNAFPHKPLVYNIVWKSLLYIAGSVVFLYLEPFVEDLFKGMVLAASGGRALQRLMLPKTWATEIILAMLLLGFVTMQELSRVIGKDQLKHMFFGQKHKPTAEIGSRDAA